MTIATKGLFKRGIGNGVALRGLFDRGFNSGAGSPASIITTQPASYVNAGQALSPVLVAKATTDGSTVDASYTGSAIATLTTGTGTLVSATVANCTAGVATFTGLTINHTIGGSGYILTVTMVGYTAVQTTAFNLVGSIQVAAMAATAALVLAIDPADQTSAGRCKAVRDVRKVAFAAGDPGVNMVAGNAHRWTDYRGSTSGGADLLPGAATDANGPTMVGTPGSGTEYLHFNGAQWMETAAAVAAYALNGVAVWVVTIVRASANGGIGGIARDSAAATVPYLLNSAVAGTYAGVTKPTATARTMDTQVATSGVTWRVLTTERMALYNGVSGMSATSSGDPETWTKIGGRVGALAIGIPFAAETYTSGNNYEVVGRQAANFMTGDVVFQMIGTGELSQANVLAIEAFAVAQFGVTLDTSKNVILEAGASLTWGADNTGTRVANQFPAYSRTQSIGPRLSLTAQNYESNDQAVNYGVSGRTVAQLTYVYDTLIAPQLDPTKGLRNIIVIGDVMVNSLNGGGLTDAQVEADLLLLLAKVVASGASAVLWTVVDASWWYTAGAYNPATSLAAKGQYAKDLNTRLRNNWTTYPGVVGLWDIGAEALWMIDKFGNGAGVQNCANAAYYDAAAGGGVHWNNGGQVAAGVSEATFFANNDYVLYPAYRRSLAISRNGSRSAR